MQSHKGLLVATVTNGPFMENCFLAADEATRQAILVDPGDEPERILAVVERAGVEVTAVVATHAHIDHVGAVAELVAALEVPFHMHPADAILLSGMRQQYMMFGLRPRDAPEGALDLTDGQELALGEHVLRVIHTPGHSAGGCSLYFATAGVVFVGDTLFSGSIGRTDLPGGSMEQLLRMIRERLFTLPEDTVVYSGHGPATTIGREKSTNPFLRPGARLFL